MALQQQTGRRIIYLMYTHTTINWTELSDRHASPRPNIFYIKKKHDIDWSWNKRNGQKPINFWLVRGSS